jgi:hypothetical protein
MQDAAFSRRMAQVVNSPYFYGPKVPIQRLQALAGLRAELRKAKGPDDLSASARKLVALAEQAEQALPRPKEGKGK